MKFSLDDINFRTRIQNIRLTEIKKIIADDKKDIRQTEKLCIFCYYTSVIAGDAFTNSKCFRCNIEMTFSSTSTDKYCLNCATIHNLCKHCGADINLTEKKTL